MKVTRAQLAGIFGVTPPAIDGWVRRGCPVAAPSRGVGRGRGAQFWTPDVVAWRDQHVVLRPTDGTPEGETTRDLQRRLLLAQTEDAELDLATKRGELLTVTAYRDALASAFGRVGARLKSMAPKLAVAVVGTDTLQDGLARVEPLVHELLRELADADDVPILDDENLEAEMETRPFDPQDFGLVDVMRATSCARPHDATS